MIRLPIAEYEPIAAHTTKSAAPAQLAGAAVTDRAGSANESAFGDSIVSRYDSDASTSAPSGGDLMACAVRMVTPMRREFGRSIDVTHFLYDAIYAKEIIRHANLSKDARLRGYATFLQERMFGPATGALLAKGEPQPESAESSLAEPKTSRGKPTAPDFSRAKEYASSSLVQLVGPSSERLCLAIESSSNMTAFVAAVGWARAVVQDIHGSAEAIRFGHATEALLDLHGTFAHK